MDMKDIVKYLNLLSNDARIAWQDMPGMEGEARFFTITEDSESGHYTRLTEFLPGADTSNLGAAVHDYQEEVLILSGDLYDAAFDTTLVAGDYTCRPLHEDHGPFRTRTGCVVLEVAYPTKV